MKRPGTGSAGRSSPRFLRSLALELTSPKTRSLIEPLAEWACRRITLESRRFSFEGHEYLRGLYDDTSPHVVLMKGAQVGGSVWGMLRSIHACLNGLHVMYLFPTWGGVTDFSKSRVGPLLADNPFLSKMMTDTDAVGLKRIGDAFLYLRGMKSSVGLKSVPADMIVFDELDEATPEAKAMARERLAHSVYRRVIELSNPSLPDFGIDEAYGRSDQRHWTVKCSHCNHWTALDREFPTKLNAEVRIILPAGDGTFFRACPKCQAPLDLAAGEWVADFPRQPIHGYQIGQLISSRVDPGEILTDYQITRFPDQFYRLKIGIPWDLAPLPRHREGRGPVERRVHLDRPVEPGVVGQVVARRRTLRVDRALPVGRRPGGGAEEQPRGEDPRGRMVGVVDGWIPARDKRFRASSLAR